MYATASANDAGSGTLLQAATADNTVSFLSRVLRVVILGDCTSRIGTYAHTLRPLIQWELFEELMHELLAEA